MTDPHNNETIKALLRAITGQEWHIVEKDKSKLADIMDRLAGVEARLNYLEERNFMLPVAIRPYDPMKQYSEELDG